MADDPRQVLARAAAARGASLSALSRMLGRNVAYLQQYVARGSPRVLPERDRRMLADFLGVDEVALGGPAAGGGDVAVPWLDVSAAAGTGRVAEGERVIRAVPVAAAMLRQLGVAAADASMILVAGESMVPTLLDGDRVLIDRGDRRVPSAGAVFVIRRADAVAVKRLVPHGRTLAIVSDNPAVAEERYPREAIAVIGRARLVLREV